MVRMLGFSSAPESPLFEREGPYLGKPLLQIRQPASTGTAAWERGQHQMLRPHRRQRIVLAGLLEFRCVEARVVRPVPRLQSREGVPSA